MYLFLSCEVITVEEIKLSTQARNPHHHVVPLARISLTLSRSFYLTIPLYRPSLPEGPLDFILCPYRVVENIFKLLVQHVYVRAMGSIGEHHFWVRPYFSSSVLHVLFV